MASGSKKRLASRSPSRSAPARKTRRESTSTLSRTQQESSSPSVSTAEPIFRGQSDPYFPRNGGNVALPTSDDYAFRIQVLSTTTNLDTNVFKKAVQGLIKICFPQNVLEELGIEVITQHMRNEHAPEQNIDKMAQIFRSEMIHRVTWMLAEHLDSPIKVESSVKAIMAASASLHGASIGEDVLSDIIASLSKLKESIPNESTARLADDTELEASSLDLVRSAISENPLVEDTDCDRYAIVAPETSSEEDHVPSLSTNAKKYLVIKPILKARTMRKLSETKNEGVQQLERPPRTTHTRAGKEGKVSTSWRWDVQDTVRIENIAEHFKRTSDLFAYHALPIARQRLGPQARRKEIRLNIEAMLTAMSIEEFENWVESFRKLVNGDADMLERPSPGHDRSPQRVAPFTPAPVIGKDENDRDIKSASSLFAKTFNSEIPKVVHRPLFEQEHVKKHHRLQANAVALGAAEAGTKGKTRHTSQLVVESDSTGQRAGHTQRVGGWGVGIPRPHAYLETPIVDLLWDQSRCGEHNRAAVVQTVMKNLAARVSVDYIGMTRFDGTLTVQTKEELQMLLLGLGAKSSSVSSDRGTRLSIEHKLQPWIISHITSFPEFKTFDFVFANIMPNLSTVVDLFFDPQTPLNALSSQAALNRLIGSLKVRGFSEEREHPWGLQRIVPEVMNLLKDMARSDIYIRCLLEKVLRRVAFAHRAKFADLKFSTLVKTWQRATKQTW